MSSPVVHGPWNAGRDHASRFRCGPRRGNRGGHLWSPWPGVNRPSTDADEASFVARLTELVDEEQRSRSPAADRSDATALLNALRHGIAVDELLTRAPGLMASRLLVAYRRLDRRRRAALTSWETIATEATPDVLSEHGSHAAHLVPVAVNRLRGVALRQPAQLAAAVAASVEESERVARVALAVEGSMHRRAAGSACDTAACRLLGGVLDPGLWAHPYYVPVRVGALVPVRVAALLGERSRPSTR